MASNRPSSSQADGLQFFPQQFWGLSYHFSVFNKMYIADILNMQEYPHCPGAFVYNNHPIYKVNVLGVVVKRVENSKAVIYAVDDGTGVILCCCWKVVDQRRTASAVSCKGLPCLLWKKVTEIDQSDEEGYSLGDQICVKGILKVFRDKKEVVAKVHYKVDDALSHVARMCELPNLYMQCYDVPFELPLKVQQAQNLNGQLMGNCNKTELSLVEEMKAVIYDYISKSDHIVDLHVNDLLGFAKVQIILDKIKADKCARQEKELELLMHSLLLLEDDGLVARRSDRRNLFEVLLNKSKLERHIVQILEKETTLTQYSEKGCHYMHILDELHKTTKYAKVRRETVNFCLDKLEAQSEVIRSTHSHYLPCRL